MAVGQKSLKLLRYLEGLAATETSQLPADYELRGLRAGRIPKSAGPTQVDPGWLLLTGDELDLHNECLGSLASEPELEHITR